MPLNVRVIAFLKFACFEFFDIFGNCPFRSGIYFYPGGAESGESFRPAMSGDYGGRPAVGDILRALYARALSRVEVLSVVFKLAFAGFYIADHETSGSAESRIYLRFHSRSF
jgi:hypothetical protein